MIKQSQEYLNLKQAAEYLGIGESTAKNRKSPAYWCKWEKFGVVASRWPGRMLKFKRSDLDRMMEETKVTK